MELKSIGHECMRGRRGLSLVEIVVVLIIVAIITVAFGVSANRNIKRTNRETVVNEMQVLASNFSDAYYDQGNPAFDPHTDEGLVGFKQFLQLISSEYLGYAFDMDSITPTANGFHVVVSDPVDVYEQNYEAWFVTSGATSRYVMVASGGDDGIIQSSGYASHNYSDDIVLVVKPKVSE